jgi:hypothetical protein
LEEFYNSLSQALMNEFAILPPAKAKSGKRRNRKSLTSAGQISPNNQISLPNKAQKNDKLAMDPTSFALSVKESSAIISPVNVNRRQEKLSWVVILLLITLITFNVLLYVKLWKMDDQHTVEIVR